MQEGSEEVRKEGRKEGREKGSKVAREDFIHVHHHWEMINTHLKKNEEGYSSELYRCLCVCITVFVNCRCKKERGWEARGLRLRF